MLDLALVRGEPARVKAALARRGVGPEAVDRAARIDDRWLARQEVAEALRVRRRRIAEEVADRRRAGADTADIEQLGREVAGDLRTVAQEMADLDAARRRALADLPNLPATDVPGEPPHGTEPPAWPHDFAPLHHADLLETLGLVHPGGGTATGRGFLTWRDAGARLVRALVAFMLDLHTGEHGCEEVRCPALATGDELFGSAHLPTLAEKMYAVESGDDAHLYLVPRAEPHLANLLAGQTLEAGALPRRFVAAGPAFRAEIGSHGRAGRGLLRLHQFPTVELYTFCRPDRSNDELVRAAGAARAVLQRLGLPHRERLRAAPELSHAAAKTVDLEVWAPGVGEWLGVAALSDFTDYQARRTNTRFVGAAGDKPRLVHTVGGAAVAVPRLLAAMLETGQGENGSVGLPEALGSYVPGLTLRPPA